METGANWSALTTVSVTKHRASASASGIQAMRTLKVCARQKAARDLTADVTAMAPA
ncbi:hypothetical protein DPMN_003918 [Dreissena polymorpha]|uniref:Uncharacterized protein n=1 Tax=Dreissena polymorpha TaxID=45954 RepID=A0A9D4RSI2_DREPO|nr:hypothetical protein DPMN_003918 [Dreissena polymorpha]